MKIVYMRKAKNDMRLLYDYISIEQDSPQRARNVISKIKAAADKLKEFPNRYREWKDSGLRYFLVSGNYVFYQYDESTETVNVVRVINAHRNIDELI